ncbi:MAG: serine hydrolase [Pseudomonadales bacterium]|nr:serine hydrolase [Pseudomonadales bacterium]
MKKALIAVGILLAAIAALLASLGLSITNLKSNLDVGLGITAKLGCSGRFVSGFTPRKIIDDIRTYSEAAAIFTVHFDETNNVTTSSIFGFFPTSATYRPGLGCTLNIGDTTHLDEIIVTKLDEKSELDRQIDPQISDALNAMLARDQAQSLDTRALVVVKEGYLVAESYAPDMGVGTRHLAWSMGKSLTSLLVGNLVMNGKLEVDQTNLFTEWHDERAQISLENLLQMSSGLAFDETYAPGSDATRMLFSAYDTAAVARELPLTHPPGEHFAYSSGTTALLASLVTRTLGGPAATYDYLNTQLLGPLGIQTLIAEPDPSGVFVGSSYVYGTARDWARLGLVYLNQGTLDGEQIVHPDWIAASIESNTSGNNQAYGYQVWLNNHPRKPRYPDLPRDAYSMQGNRGQVVMILPTESVVIVRLGWSPTAYPTNQNFAQLLDALAVE